MVVQQLASPGQLQLSLHVTSGLIHLWAHNRVLNPQQNTPVSLAAPSATPWYNGDVPAPFHQAKLVTKLALIAEKGMLDEKVDVGASKLCSFPRPGSSGS